MKFKINNNFIGEGYPTYFIADIAANHDGDINRAKRLIELAKKAGADAVKFQHHDVRKYVSDKGFKSLGGKFSHQKSWDKSIFEVYKDAEVPINWTEELKKHAEDINVDFFSTPYDLEMVDHLDAFVPAYKIGSGDLAWHEMIKKVGSKNKPVFLATGASTLNEVKESMQVLKKINNNICLMQCNTNYTADETNFNYLNLRVINEYKKEFPNILYGLSDHTLGSVSVLVAVGMGIHAVEKHFTDDNDRPGPDHPFSMNPVSWKEMVDATRLAEKSLGDGVKKVEDNEKETVILQRRSIRLINDKKNGEILTRNDIEFQRPSPSDSLNINEIDKVINKKINKNLQKGDYLKLDYFN